MVSDGERHDPVEVDEGSWVYLSADLADDELQRVLLEQITEACAKSGWRTVSHPVTERVGRASDPGRFFAGVSDAIKHADAVVALIGARTDMSDAELTLAYSHGRPVVGVRVEGATMDSEPRMLLDGYERGRVVACSSPGECAAALRQALSDPAFADVIREAR